MASTVYIFLSYFSVWVGIYIHEGSYAIAKLCREVHVMPPGSFLYARPFCGAGHGAEVVVIIGALHYKPQAINPLMQSLYWLVVAKIFFYQSSNLLKTLGNVIAMVV